MGAILGNMSLLLTGEAHSLLPHLVSCRFVVLLLHGLVRVLRIRRFFVWFRGLLRFPGIGRGFRGIWADLPLLHISIDDFRLPFVFLEWQITEQYHRFSHLLMQSMPEATLHQIRMDSLAESILKHLLLDHKFLDRSFPLLDRKVLINRNLEMFRGNELFAKLPFKSLPGEGFISLFQ